MEAIIEREEVLAPELASKLELFAGKNSAYYLKRWQVKINHVSEISWNWAGFILGIYWLGYRKMYKPVFIIFGIYLANDLLLYTLDARRVSVGLFIQFAVGLYANMWYFKAGIKKIKEAEAASSDLEVIHEQLRVSGGTSWKGVLFVIALTALYLAITVACDLAISSLR